MLRKTFVVAVLALTSFMCANAAFAANYDQVKAIASAPLDEPQPLIVNNGAVPGTIQVIYTVNANQFTDGLFASFDVALSILKGSTSASYPTNLALDQNGSSNLQLQPVTSTFTVTGSTWNDVSHVSITIPSSVPLDPSLNCDGCTLVGNLNLAADSRSHLGTATTIQVKLVLVHPAGPCLRVYDLLLNNDTGLAITSATYTVKHSTGLVNGTQPGQMLDAILVANTCPSDETFDVVARLDPHFETLPHNNPGNAVFTYTKAGVVDDTTFTLSAFSGGTAQGQNLCLAPISLPAGDTFLMTVKMDEMSDITPVSSATFSGFVLNQNSSCDTTNQKNPLASPNPASATLTLTLQ
jgi:hypothetical protein